MRVFADTGVLFPFSVMDLLLALTEDGVHELVWTDDLLAEWERVIVREHQRSADTAASVTAAIREHFGDLRIGAAPPNLVAKMPGADPDDHVHSAAAVNAGIDILLTWDTAGFPAAELAALGLRVADPDAYLVQLLDEAPAEVSTAVRTVARSKTRPPLTVDQILDRLAAAGVPDFAGRMRDRV